jgi:hypothetical protein
MELRKLYRGGAEDGALYLGWEPRLSLAGGRYKGLILTMNVSLNGEGSEMGPTQI